MLIKSVANLIANVTMNNLVDRSVAREREIWHPSGHHISSAAFQRRLEIKYLVALVKVGLI
jgi:hypothetical protein